MRSAALSSFFQGLMGIPVPPSQSPAPTPEHPWPLGAADPAGLATSTVTESGSRVSPAKAVCWALSPSLGHAEVTFLCGRGAKGIRVVVWFVPGHGAQAACPQQTIQKGQDILSSKAMRSIRTGSRGITLNTPCHPPALWLGRQPCQMCPGLGVSPSLTGFFCVDFFFFADVCL